MIKFIHAADVHLDSPLHRLEAYEGAPAEEIRQASRRAFENLIDLAIDESVDFVLIAGDLFDGSWKDYNTGLYFITQISRLKARSIAVFLISGNHDATGQMTRSLPYPDNVHHFSHLRPETKSLDHLKVAVHGQSFSTAAVIDNLALSYPEPIPEYFNIGLLHTSLTGREGHENYAPCALDDLKNKGYDYWALGHVHQYEMVCEDPPIVFPGCTQGRHIKETGIKGCVLVTIAEGTGPEVVQFPLDVIRWELLDINLNNAETKQACLELFVAAMEKQVVLHEPLPVIARVVFTGKTPTHTLISGDPSYWKEAVRAVAISNFGERAWIEKVNVSTQPHARGKEKPAVSGPIQELDRLVADIKTDEDNLLALGNELEGLFRKLPAEYKQGEEAIDPGNPQAIIRIVDQAHAVLEQGLKGKASGS